MADKDRNDTPKSGDQRNDPPNTGGRVDSNKGDKNHGDKGGNQR